MERLSRERMHASSHVRQRYAVLLTLLMLSSLLATLPLSTYANSARSTTIWSGTVNLPDGYTVESADVVIVEDGTIINLGDDKTILVAGRLTVEGTSTNPVILDAPLGNHDGIVFNSTSDGKGSKIENLTVKNSEYGITVYESDPVLNDVRVENADLVAIDLFDSASPIINNLVIEGGGQDIPLATTWRKGIGLSIGAGSSPIVNGVTINDLTTRGINYWGNSGGMLSNLQITNVSGATTAISAGIWVEDSRPLIMDSNVSRCDNGVYVRKITQSWTTRPTFHRLGVEDSQYRGVMVEQYNHSQFSNLPINAIFQDLEIRGTGGAGAKTPGLGFAALEVNTSGIKIERGLIEDNPVVGFRAYMIDSSTIIDELTVLRSGDSSLSAPINDRAGIFWRSANWGAAGPPSLTDLVVRNSSGPGVLLWKGGAYGSDWNITGNAGNGVDFREFHPEVSHVVSMDNGGSGISVRDSSNVELEYIYSYRNGHDDNEFSIGAGFYFEESNDVVSSGKNVTCTECISVENEYGIVVRDSIDLQFISTEIRDSSRGSALDIDNSGLSRAGPVLIDDMVINSNSSEYAIDFDTVDAHIQNLDLNGDNGGMKWSAASTLTSYLNNSVIRGNQTCFDLSEQSELLIHDLVLFCSLLAAPTFDNSFVNFTDSTMSVGANFSNHLELGSSSHVRWISSEAISDPTSSASDSILDVMWNVEVHVVNQLLNHIPYAEVNLTFDSLESEFITTLPYEGWDVVGPFIGKRWTSQQGWSEANVVYTGCDYDGVHNDSQSMNLDGDKSVLCILELSNQPPFILWDTPLDEDVFSSGAEVVFDASASWDLDEDELSYTWTSNIDGDLSSSCQGSGNWSIINANFGGLCLSDGTHTITLEVCDTENHCVSEQREIELVNRPPSLSVDTTPDISPWGTLYLGRTASIEIDLNGTTDPEGDDLDCWVSASYEMSVSGNGCPMLIVRDFPGAPNQFQVTVHASDGINPEVTWTFNVELFNELPSAELSVERSGNLSANLVRLDGTSSSDPEGDNIKFEFHSNIDGLIGSGQTPDDAVEWIGTLSKGTHQITLKVSDDRPNHAGNWRTVSEIIVVENSPPVALISNPSDASETDSSELISFDATGSGDWDIACVDMPDSGVGLICDPSKDSSRDLVSVLWESDSLSEPLGSDWRISARLPAGEHTITLTIDDGDGGFASDSISVSVGESAPILILDSPIPDVEVYSNLPVLFDFRRSFDADGDDFTVSVTSDIMNEPILENKTNEFWYNDYIPAGTHELTFELTDSTGLTRIHKQNLIVLETAPVAGISGLSEGQYIPPGTELILNGSASYDYDDDIVLYQWSLADGTNLGDREEITVQFPPGPVQIILLVKDSRGEIGTLSLNLTIGSSSPQLAELTINPTTLDLGEPTPIFLTVILDDPDGTTERVLCEFKAGGIVEEYELRDDGAEGDLVAGDGIWTLRTIWTVEQGTSAKVEVWAVDGEIVSPVQIEILKVDDGSGDSFVAWLLGGGLPLLFGLILLAIALGAMYSVRRRRELERDLEMIESWSQFEQEEF